jgi:imidazolonepropionase-like amidohydrolase
MKKDEKNVIDAGKSILLPLSIDCGCHLFFGNPGIGCKRST